ncbi:helix-turn-helix domain-containing protein [Steroidobacter agaridevorans]|uniref:helix-turn-helix domain-containing protein n=1 Tax=Steroidobacter agaridevorans TaxID=2695856 RepID=UPI0013211A59|nr:helix-turn-helix domain-containing protein [Steroidobacter agaridevorans]GFE87743.1 AraC family transcriptional regulator [Steroidobacter agaridevorans]
MTSFDPKRPDFAPYGFTCELWRPTPMPRPDRHNEIEINLLRSGLVTYLLGGRKVQVAAQRLSVFWAAIPHQILSFEDTTEYFVVTLPLAWFLQCKLPDQLVKPLLHGEVIAESIDTRAAADIELLSRWEQDFREPGESLRKAVLLELEARLLRLAVTTPSATSRRPRPGHRAVSHAGLSKVEQMACFIAQRYTQPLSVEEIGEVVGLHPNYAMNLFKKTFGITLVNYITQHRVSHAQRLLATTDAKIVDIALASGFTSTSRFNAAFDAECGCSPRAYRREHQLTD